MRRLDLYLHDGIIPLKAIMGRLAPSEEVNVMTVVSVSELKDTLSETLNRAAFGQERIVVASRGRPKAAVISIDDLRRLEELEDAQAAREALEAYQAGETVPWEEVKAELMGQP
jgi:prevent-host-death family protein